MVQKSPGVIFAHSLLGYAVLGFLELIGTSAEVEMKPFGSLPSGWAVFAGHFALSSLARSPRVLVSRIVDVAGVGAAKATAERAASVVKILIMRLQ